MAQETALPRSDKAAIDNDKALANTPVNERVQPGYDLPVNRIGSFLLKPSVQVMENFDSNIYADPSKKSDFITSVSPHIDLSTINEERGFDFSIGSNHRFYHQHTDENTNDYDVVFSPHWMITHALNLKGQVSWEQNHEAREDADAVDTQGAEEPTEFHRSHGRIEANYKPGRLGLNLSAESAHYSFENAARMGGGVEFINNDRDRYENAFTIALNCDITDRSLAYWQNDLFNRDYQRSDFDPLTSTYSGPHRDSKGIRSVIGLKMPVTHLISLDVDGGIHTQNFDDPTFKDVHTGAGQVKFTWMMTPLTTLDFSGERQVYETIQMGASAYIQSKANVTAYHELRRNIVLNGSFFIGSNDYIGFDRKDDFIGGGAGVTYMMNRYLDWKASYLYDSRTSNLSAAEYNRHQVFLTAKVVF